MSEAPLVSVAMITYNHRPYIAKALESVIAQRRDFPIEIVISDDCSPDRTAEIIDAYQAANPGLFRRIDSPHNVGMHANFDRVWRACTGKYIALLEGDDWWHFTEKLTTQVAFMESRPDCTVSGHRVRRVTDDAGSSPSISPERPERFETADLIASNDLPTLSVMCLRGVVPALPEWICQLGMCDWPMTLLHSLQGHVGFINQVMGTYRLHKGGAFSMIGEMRQLELQYKALSVMRNELPERLIPRIDSALAQQSFELFSLYRENRKYRVARRQLLQFLRHSISARKLSWTTIAKAPFWLAYPGLRLPFRR